MKEFKNIQSLKEAATPVKYAVKYYFKNSDKLFPKTNKELERGYAVNNGVIAFSFEGILYAIKYSDNVLRMLRENGFTHKSMYIPVDEMNWVRV